HQQPRGAAATAAVAISSPPVRGRAFAYPLADCGRIADLRRIRELRNQPQFARALPHKPQYPPNGSLSPYSAVLRTGSRACGRVCLRVGRPTGYATSRLHDSPAGHAGWRMDGPTLHAPAAATADHAKAQEDHAEER